MGITPGLTQSETRRYIAIMRRSMAETEKRATHRNAAKYGGILRKVRKGKKDKKMKTIAEIAKQCNVSKTTISRYISVLDMKESIETDQAGTMLLTEEQEQKIKKALKQYEATRNARNAPRKGKENKEPEKTEAATLAEIKELKKQIAEKDAQIKELHSIIEKNQTIIDQQQKLTLITQQRILALEDKQNRPGLFARLFRRSEQKTSTAADAPGADQGATTATNEE